MVHVCILILMFQLTGVLFGDTAIAGSFTNNIEEPWEAEDIATYSPQNLETLLPREKPINPIVGMALGFYRKHVSAESIDRCPFVISCSYFAERAIRTHGFLSGIGLFVDRHFFREHPGASLYYGLQETMRGSRVKLKLNDSYFLVH